MSRFDAIVIGGGFAGLSAATTLAERGRRVVLLESRPRLGGRATSYLDRVTGDRVDNGQHVLFGCYAETFRFLRRIGAEQDVRLQPQLAVDSVDRDGRLLRYRTSDLPAPLHLVSGVLEWDDLDWRDRVGALRLLGPLRALERGDPDVVRPDETVRDWLHRHGQTPRLCETLWEPLALAALNQPADRALAPPFVRVLQRLCGPGPTDASVGLPRRSLEELYAVPARRSLEASGGLVVVRAAARVVAADNGRFAVVARREAYEAPVLVSAVPWFAMARLFDPPPSALAPLVDRAARMRSSPIVTVHLWYDRVVLPSAFRGLIGRDAQWVFEAPARDTAHGQRLTLVSSGADHLLRLSNQSLVARARADAEAAAPTARGTRLRHALVIREPRATFSLESGEPTRPEARTAVRGLVLAGDWIETGLPGTIEGAVVSGHRAADLVSVP